MRAGEFTRKRARILQRAKGRAKFYERAMRHLVREAGAREIVINGKVAAWALPAGGAVCTKARYMDQGAANDELSTIQRHEARSWFKHPARAYPCPLCGGWHLTSRAA